MLLAISAAILVGCSGQEPASNKQLSTQAATPDPELGKVLFAASCKGCHGSEAQGTKRGPPLIHKIYEPGHHADFSFYRAVSAGVRSHHWSFGDMPPIHGVSPQEVGHIVAYIRQKQRQAGIQ
jgi:cytochrome c2